MNDRAGEPGSAAPLLAASGLSKAYRTKDDRVVALDGIDLSLRKGEVVMVFGPSGSGKTTLLNLLAGLDAPDAGSITFAGRRYDRWSDAARTRLRLNHIATIFQSFELIKVMTCLDNIAYPALLKRLPRAEIKARIAGLAERLEIGALLDRKPESISAGQRQRVAIARALVHGPQVVLGDEVTANLDRRLKHSMLSYLKELSGGGTTFLLVSHDQDLAAYADRAFRLSDGRLAAHPTGSAAC